MIWLIDASVLVGQQHGRRDANSGEILPVPLVVPVIIRCFHLVEDAEDFSLAIEFVVCGGV